MSKEGTRPAQGPHRWEFKARFRRRAFGWRSQAAIQRVKEAVKEIRKAARRDPILGAEGAVLFLERVSGALEQVDSSSGAIGAAVNRAIEELVPIVAGAPAGAEKRQQWLERLFEAHADDGIPYIELLADHWGELCASKEVASAWADELIDITRMALGPDPDLRGHFHGATACLSALYRAERYEELVNVLEAETFWAYERWAVKALGAMGRKAEAIRLAEASRGPGTNDADVDRLCEEILLSSGLVEEAYTRYGLHMRRGTYLATFRALAKRYPTKEREEILADLVREVPGEEGKWFATAKDLGLYHLAVRLAWTSPCDPRTLAPGPPGTTWTNIRSSLWSPDALPSTGSHGVRLRDHEWRRTRCIRCGNEGRQGAWSRGGDEGTRPEARRRHGSWRLHRAGARSRART